MSNEEKLVRMLKYVSEHNDFYKKRIKEYGITNPLDITQWPVLTRKELQENRYNMFSEGYKSKYYNQQLLRQSSSGSSGIPVNVYWDYKDWYTSNLSLWRKRWNLYGIRPGDKYMLFTLDALNMQNDGESIYYIKQSDNIIAANVSLIQNDSGYNKLVDIIDEFKPKWFYVQPFVLNKLIQAYRRVEKTPPRSLEYIESVGEILSADLRRRSIELFGVSIANMYGSEEMNSIAYEYPDSHIYTLNDNVFLEVKNEQGVYHSYSGCAIITNLNNKAMPLIRYSQGDALEIVLPKSPKKFFDPIIIKTIKGRVLDAIKLPNGMEINPYLLLEVISEVNNYTKDMINDFAFTYHKYSNILDCCLAVSNASWQENISSLTDSTLKRKLGSNIDIKTHIFQANINKDNSKKKRIVEIQEN